MNWSRYTLFSLLSILIILFISSCKVHNPFQGKPIPKTFAQTPHPPAPNYADQNCWAALPNRKDEADWIPIKSNFQDQQDSAAIDVFFIHPTVYIEEPTNEYLWNANPYDSLLNEKVDQGTIKLQASIFNGAGRIFAPRYRQMHFYGFFVDNKEDMLKALYFAYDDIKSAFEYYMKHHNHGRPIIIAGHSQGTLMATQLIKDYFDGKPLQEQLVAAYLVGSDIKANELKTIPLCDCPEQTGCFVSWRTFARGYEPDFWPRGCAAVNPLSWKTDSLPVDYSANKGAVLSAKKKIYKHLFNAQTVHGYLWVDKPKIFGGFLVRRKNFHIGDYNLFYVNVRENAILRTKTFLENQEKNISKQ